MERSLTVRRRRLILGALGGSALALLAACGQQAGGIASPPPSAVSGQSSTAAPTTAAASSGQATPAAKGKASAPQGTVTGWYVFTGDSPQGKTMPQIADAFNKAHPGLTANVQFGGASNGTEFAQKLLTAVAAGAPPDTMTIDVIWPSRFASSNAITALDTYAKRDGVDFKDFLAAPLDACTYKGQVYALPLQTGTLLLYYNKDLFKSVGLDPEKPPQTWDDLLAYAQKLTKTPDQWGLNIPIGHDEGPVWNWHCLVWQNGGELTNSDNTKDTFNDEKGVEALQFWVDMVHKYKVATLSPPQQAFATGKFGMSTEVPSQISYYEGAKVPFEFGTAVLPKKVGAASNTGGWNWAIAKGSKNPDGAWEWVKFATNRDSLIAWNSRVTMIAPRQSVRDDSNYQAFEKKETHWQAVMDTIPIMRIRPKLAGYLEWSNALGQQIEAAIYQRASVQDALNKAAQDCDAILAKEPK